MTRSYSLDRRAYLKTVGAAASVTVVAGCLDDDDETVINPGTASGFPPFEFIEDGELTGFDVDLTEAVVEEAGFELGEWTDLDFDSLIPALTDGDIDFIAAAMTITEDRAETIAFTDPYFESDQSVLVREGGDFQPTAEADLAEAAGIGAQSGTTGEGEVERLIDEGVVDGGDFTTYDNYPLAIEDLTAEIIDAVMVDLPVAESFEATRDVEIAFTIETGEEFGFGMRQDDTRIDDINTALGAVQDDSTYDDIVADYFG